MNLGSILVLVNLLATAYLIYLIYRRKNQSHLQIASTLPAAANIKIGLNRFNPFSDLGGNQSFILCLLDNTNSGVIITSLHNRDRTRVYSKPIKNGNGLKTPLSPEEKKTLLTTISHYESKT